MICQKENRGGISIGATSLQKASGIFILIATSQHRRWGQCRELEHGSQRAVIFMLQTRQEPKRCVAGDTDANGKKQE